jgi:DNA-binding transcriptional MocR family regulator
MSEGRRREVLRIARERRTVIVEDTAMADLSPRPAPPHMCALSPEDVITIGSLSKCYWAGLRLGWIRAAPELIQRLGRLRASLDLGAPLLDQVAAAEIYRDFDRVTEPVRSAARDRLALLVQELHAQLPDWEFEEPEGGWSVWVRLPHGEGERFAQFALRNGVAIATGAAMAPDDRFAGHVRLSAGGWPDEIVNGVSLLARAWQRMISQPDRSGEAITLPV